MSNEHVTTVDGAIGLDDADTRPPRVVVVLLNWNDDDEIIACLESVRMMEYPDFRVVVVDNGSSDVSAAHLRERFPDVHLIENGRNLGFAGGNNVGMAQAMDMGADYILLLNNDTVVDERLLAELVAAGQREPDIGVISPKIYFHDRPNTIWFAGARVWLFYGKIKAVGFCEEDRGQYDTEEDTDWACGCSMMVKREVLETVGLLDADYFNCFEDVDFCLRVARAGYRTVYAPTAKVWHKGAVSMGGIDSPYYAYYQTRNHLLLMRKNTRYCWPFFLPHFIAFNGYRIARFLGKGNFSGCASILRGTLDFFRGKWNEGAGASLNHADTSA